jgi:hypothetical protein
MTPEERFQKYLGSIEPNVPYGIERINENIKELEGILEGVKDNPPPILLHSLQGERKKKQILESQENDK